MPTVITHTFVAICFSCAYSSEKMTRHFWFWSVICSIVPDIDVLGFRFGIQYGDLLGHRGLTHSLFFAFVLALIVVTISFKDIAQFSKKLSLFLYFFILTASHGFLDALTNGGLGIAFFSPFITDRYFLPWRPLKVSPIGLDTFLHNGGTQVILSELLWIWTYCGLLLLLVWTVRRILTQGVGKK